VERVVTTPTTDDIATPEPIDNIITAKAQDHIPAGSAVEHVGALGPHHRGHQPTAGQAEGEHMGRTPLVGGVAGRPVVTGGADHQRLPTDRHRTAEVVAVGGVGVGQLLSVGEGATTAHKHMGRTSGHTRPSIKVGADHNRVPIERH
jgi:hypothetical protein